MGWYRTASKPPKDDINVLAWSPGELVKVVNSSDLSAQYWAPIPALPNTKVCPYCGTEFAVVPNIINHTVCGKRDCKKARLIEIHGGVSGHRAWERDNKRKQAAKKKSGR
jgi:hypothetical protein